MTNAFVPLEQQFPLHAAAVTGDVKQIEQAIGQYVDSSLGFDGCTPLVLAAREGKLDAVKLLVGLKANVNNKSSTQGIFALSTAAHAGHTEVVEFLLDCKADIDMVSIEGELGSAIPYNLLALWQGTLL